MDAAGAKAKAKPASRRQEAASGAPVGGASPAQRAGYIEEMAAELERLAVGPELERLRELLGLARREARRVLTGQAG